MTSPDEQEQKIPIETYGFIIDVRSKNAYESVYGKKTLELAHILHCIKLETFKKDISPHVLFQLIRSFFGAIKSQDPLTLHQNLARKVLENECKKEKLDSICIDLLSREICNVFNTIADKLFPISWMKEVEDSLNKSAQEQGAGEAVLNIIELDGPNADKDCFNNKGIFKPLEVYITVLESLGKKGKEHACKIREKEVNADSEFWFNPPEKGNREHFFHSAAFLGISRIIWKERVKKRVDFDEKFPPCAVKPTFKILSSLMTAKKDNNSPPHTINLINGTDIIGKIEIPLVPVTLYDKVCRGAGKITTVIGHKAIRYAAALPFKQKLKGVSDFRTKEFEGGFVELGEEMGITHKKSLAGLREVLYALKHLDIHNIKESRITKGSLLDITHFKSSKTGREDGLILTVLPTLVAYGETDCKGMLLIPIATLSPPVHGIIATQYHAGLYYLQMLLLEEFSGKSKEFYQHKCIQINETDWERLLRQANIPIKYKDRILQGWTVGNNDAPMILERVEKDHYTLGKAYEKPSKFLMEQGKIRSKQSLKGKASAQKKKKKN